MVSPEYRLDWPAVPGDVRKTLARGNRADDGTASGPDVPPQEDIAGRGHSALAGNCLRFDQVSKTRVEQACDRFRT
jgi:hypothetical protein